MTEPILCLVRDLLFYSKIRVAAESAGVVLKSVRDPVKLAYETGAGLVVDLNQPFALDAAVEWRNRTEKMVVGFVSHVDTESIAAAKVARIDRILVRSQFEQNLPAIFAQMNQKS